MSLGHPSDSLAARADLLGVVWRKLLGIVAGMLLVIYLCWNLYWLSQGRLAPSLFLAITGLPCATTGCTRSLLAWSRGDWLEALRYNPFSLAFVALFAASGAQVAWQLRRQLPRSLHPVIAWGWGICLTAGWIYKLASNPAYW